MPENEEVSIKKFLAHIFPYLAGNISPAFLGCKRNLDKAMGDFWGFPRGECLKC
jgi:hypothetical protein